MHKTFALYRCILKYSIASSPPIVTSVVAVDTHSVRVDWMIPNRVNGIILYYTIIYTIENGMKRTIDVNFNGKLVSSIKPG